MAVYWRIWCAVEKDEYGSEKIVRYCLSGVACCTSLFRPLSRLQYLVWWMYYSQYKRREFKSCPSDVWITPKIRIIGGKYIEIGHGVHIHGDTILSGDFYKLNP